LLSKRRYGLLLALFALAGAIVISAATAAAGRARSTGRTHIRHDAGQVGDGHDPRTPIKHVVVIFGENVSFDHYFGTYPNAANTDGQKFAPASGTPAVDGLPPATASSLPTSLRHSTNRLTSNPNAALPQRLDSTATGVRSRRDVRLLLRRQERKAASRSDHRSADRLTREAAITQNKRASSARSFCWSRSP
jgi:phospholipase C